MIGTTLGPYKIIEQLGAGGMGEVYRAFDPRLDRDVAIKVLPEDFSADPDRLARFEREAKLLASLNHANIATIHGLEDADGVRFIAMECVEGETLAERLARSGPVEVDEALDIARQIAEALEAAHENGVIHRDLKPANVKVTPDGRVKVLDFGLAKAYEADGSSSDISPELSHSPTMAAATRTGVILGTAAYMSPEQARGKIVDKRTDIWAFGCVLYEMLAGKRPFSGETVSDTIAAILKEEPDWGRLPTEANWRVVELLRRCLSKDPGRRLRDIGDARLDLLDAPELPEELGSAAIQIDRAGTLRPVVVAVVLSSLVTAIALWMFLGSEESESRAVIEFSFEAPPIQDVAFQGTVVTISPDGSTIAFAAGRGEESRIYVRRIDDMEARPIDGTEGGFAPFFSPDSAALGYLKEGEMRRASLDRRGNSLITSPISGYVQGVWAPNGTIYLSSQERLFEVPSEAGDPRRVDSGPGLGLGHCQVLPAGDSLLCNRWVGPTWDQAEVVRYWPGSGELKILAIGATHSAYASSGHLLYTRADGTLYAASFNVGDNEVGEPQVVLDDVMVWTGSGTAQFAVSETGTLVYVSSESRLTRRRLMWVARDGNGVAIGELEDAYRDPRVSPTGDRIALSVEATNDDVHVLNLAPGALTRLTFGNDSMHPVWSPDGQSIAFAAEIDRDNKEIYVVRADRSDEPRRWRSSEVRQDPSSWSGEGGLIAYVEFHPETGADVWVAPADGNGDPTAIATTTFAEMQPAISPDGRYVAYASDSSLRNEIYVMRVNGEGGATLVSPGGGTEPLWNPAGGELFYRDGDTVMLVDVSTEGAFGHSNARPLFTEPYMVSPWVIRNYDISSDGRRFLMVESELGSLPVEIKVIVNWFEELEEAVPPGQSR